MIKNSTLPTFLTCPFCQSPIIISEKTWICDGSHNHKGTKHPFDVARQGYINLLPVQNKKSKNPGDSQESIAARQRFLQRGFYQPLQKTIIKLIKNHLLQTSKQQAEKEKNKYDIASKPKLITPSNLDTIKQNFMHCNWLDLGCGDGYYSQSIANIENITNLLAIDISKPAVLELAKAAKQNKQLWLQNHDNNKGKIIPLVASASKLPLDNHSVQGVSSIFSPILPDELARVLVDKGILLIAKPDEGHLSSMRSGLFDNVREHDSDKFLETLTHFGFNLLHTGKVSNTFSLDHAQLADLLTMTPYSYRAKHDKREALLKQAKLEGFKTQAKFVVYILQKS